MKNPFCASPEPAATTPQPPHAEPQPHLGAAFVKQPRRDTPNLPG
jgi:hypothetical protein